MTDNPSHGTPNDDTPAKLLRELVEAWEHEPEPTISYLSLEYWEWESGRFYDIAQRAKALLEKEKEK